MTPFSDQTFRRITESQTLLINEQSRLLQEAGRSVYRMGFGQSPFPPPQSAIDALRAGADRKEYSSVKGLVALREAAAAFHSPLCGVDFDVNNIFAAPGSKTLLYSIMAGLAPTDVLIPSPAWVSYEPQARLTGHQVMPIACTFEDRWRVTPDALTRCLEARVHRDRSPLVILTYPGNPDGLSYTDTELKALADTLMPSNAIVISDEIYGLLAHDGHYRSIARFYPWTVVTTGLSKWCGAGGWRLGLGLVSNDLSSSLVPVLTGVASEIYSCAPTPMQLAAAVAYENIDVHAEYLDAQRRSLAAIGNYVQRNLAGAGLAVHAPQGGFYLMPDFTPLADEAAAHGINSSADICSHLLNEAGVAALPGEAFGLPPTTLAVRLAYVDFDGPAVLNAVLSSAKTGPLGDDFVRTACPRIVAAVEAITGWTTELRDQPTGAATVGIAY